MSKLFETHLLSSEVQVLEELLDESQGKHPEQLGAMSIGELMWAKSQ